MITNSLIKRSRMYFLSVLLMITSLAFAGNVYAETTVCAAGCDYLTIQEALDNASDNEVIKVMDAVHTEAFIDFSYQSANSVTVKGQGRDATIIQAIGTQPTPGVDSPFVFGVFDNKNLIIRDLHIRYGGFLGQGGALLCFDGKLEMHDARVSDSTSRFGGGLFMRRCHGSRLNNVIVEDNSAVAPGRGGGLYLIDSGDVVISDSVFQKNSAEAEGGGIRVVASELSFNKSRLLDNEGFQGGGIAVIFNSLLRFTEGTISSNKATWGGGVYLAEADFSSTVFRIFSSTVSHNSATIGGGGLNVDAFRGGNPRAVLLNSTVSNNSAGDTGSGVYVTAQDPFSEARVDSYASTIADNKNVDTPDKHAISTRTESFGDALFVYGNSIITNPDAGTENCGAFFETDPGQAVISDAGSNVSSDFSCNIFNGGSFVADPKLGPLQDNGGSTLTHRFRFADSLAVDRHNDPDCGQPSPFPGDIDQRGVVRPQGAGCDSGAVELTPVDAIKSQIDFVEELIGAGTFEKSWGKALSRKLTKALSKLDDGNTEAGKTKLRDFITQMENLVADGKISEENSASTIATIQWALFYL